MKLIKQTILRFQEGNSDKIYEIDLCEVEDGMFVVNFRYGRRGSALREGTKTVFPVDYNKAVSVFDALANSKTKKGYTDQANPAPSVSPTTPINSAGRDETIIKHLVNALKGNSPKHWKVSKILWRAGDLKITDAIPHIIPFLQSEDYLTAYASCYALGKIKAKDAGEALVRLYEQTQDKALKRASLIALLNILDKREQFLLLEAAAPILSYEFKQAVLDFKEESARFHIQDQILNKKNYAYFWNVYLWSFHAPFLKKELINILKNIPFTAGPFKYIRYIFKATEIAEDYEIYGTLAYRFETSPQGFAQFYGSAYFEGEYYRDTQAELQKPNSKLAFSANTKLYLEKRNLRNLNRQGIDQSAEYTKWATSILLSYSDEKDKRTPYKRTNYSYDWENRRYMNVDVHYDEYSTSMLLNFILYNNSSRYKLTSNKKNWICEGKFQPGNEIPQEREEAFPQLWNNAKDDLLKLLFESKVERVHQFAAKAFKDNVSFFEDIDAQTIINFLSSEYPLTVDLGFTIARANHKPNEVTIDLVYALLKTELSQAHELAQEWINENPSAYLCNLTILAALVCCPSAQVREFVFEKLPTVPKSEADDFLSLIITNIFELKNNEIEITNEVCSNLDKKYPELFSLVFDREVLETLLHADKPHLLLLAATILAASDDVEKNAGPYLSIFLNADHTLIRTKGIELLSRFSDSGLAKQSDLLASFCISEHSDIRQSAHSIISRLAKSDEAFSKKLSDTILPLLFQKEKSPGLHDDLVKLFTTQLTALLESFNSEDVEKMLRSKFEGAQKLGEYLFFKNRYIDKMEISQIVSLASCDILAIRESVWKHYKNYTSAIKREIDIAYKIIDAKWEDSRAFAFTYFKDHFGQHDWTPEVIIAICDSIREDVQTYGRNLVTTFFKEENGYNYLIKLSQHPSQNLQLFCTNFVERYATDKPEIILSLKHYFKTVLGKINTGSISKKRIFAFLKKEALRSEESARIIAEIINELSLTISIQDKSACIEILYTINAFYPAVEIVLTEKKIEVR